MPAKTRFEQFPAMRAAPCIDTNSAMDCMDKSPDAFRTISEVADWLGTPTHVLRFWESRFSQVKPVKRAGGRRYYRPSDMALLGGIKKLLHDDGMTIRGAPKIRREQGIKYVSGLSRPVDGSVAEAEAGLVLDAEPDAQSADILDMKGDVADLSEDVVVQPEGPQDAEQPVEPVRAPAEDDVTEEITLDAASQSEDPIPFEAETSDPLEQEAEHAAAAPVSDPLLTQDVPQDAPAENWFAEDQGDLSRTQPVKADAVPPSDMSAMSRAPEPADDGTLEVADPPVAEVGPTQTALERAEAALADLPPVPEGPTLAEQVLERLRAGARADSAALQPVFEKLAAVRERMDQEPET